MDVLLQHWDCRLECFASPLNCRYDRFASVFPDVDVPFGSYGSFFEWDLVSSPKKSNHQDRTSDDDDDNDDDCSGICFQANPPFCEGLILQLSNAISMMLSKTLDSARPIMFVVFVPAWRESQCYQALLENEFLTRHLLLPQSGHWYAEGTRYRRKDSFRVASFDTSILFYQNEAGKKKWNLLPQTSEMEDCRALEDLKQSFGQDPSKMDAAQQQRQILSAMGKDFVPKSKETMAIATLNEKAENLHSPAPTNLDTNGRSFKKAKQKNDLLDAKTKKKVKKRTWNDRDEKNAQLDLLHSLGLATEQKEETKTGADGCSNSSSKKKNLSKSRKAKKQKR
jgi:hypothetical protein